MTSHSLCWQRCPQSPLVIGHRGSRHRVTENTLESFDQARLEGAEGVELDVQLSADNLPFILHDATPERVSDGANRLKLRLQDAREIQRIRLPGGLRIPTLQQAIQWASQHGQLLNVEMKSNGGNPGPLAERCAEELVRSKVDRSQVLVSSFHPGLLVRFRKCAPGFAIALLLGPGRGAWARLVLDGPLRGAWLHPHHSLLQESLFIGGVSMNTWTVNDPEIAERLAHSPIQALITDQPAAMVRRLRNATGGTR